MYCPECRENLPDDAKFCIKCGYDFARFTTPPERKAGDTLDGSATEIVSDIPEQSFAIGTLYANRYEILDEGKAGGMGAVYKCKDTKLNETVALKIIHPRLLNSKNALSRFRQEVAISRRLHHVGIVKVFNLEEWEGMEYFTMEWIEGVTLRDVIEQRKKENKPFSLEEANVIISQLTDTLTYAHQYTIHRDIKPENILIKGGAGDQGLGVSEKTRIKLTDFGIAKMLSPSEFTETSIQMGTPYYMAPEQREDAASVDKRADIYACGVLLFELLTLENTIGLASPSEINKTLPNEIDEITKKSIATRPDNRYVNARRMCEDLTALCDHLKSNSGSLKERKEIEGIQRRVPIRLGKQKTIVIIVVIVLLVAAGWTLYQKVKEGESLLRYENELFGLYTDKKDLKMTDRLIGELESLDNRKNAREIDNEMVMVKGGCFYMGDRFKSGGSDEKPLHKVCVDDFYIGKYEVTQSLWKEVMGSNPSLFIECGDTCPVDSISWSEAQVFLEKLNYNNVGGKYRLPTEAEWEYACRSGGEREEYCGINDEEITSIKSDLFNIVSPKKINGLGIYDMSGQLSEWVNDWYDSEYYKSSPMTNPKGPSTGDFKVVRGGELFDFGASRSSDRLKLHPLKRGYRLGFRVARTPD